MNLRAGVIVGYGRSTPRFSILCGVLLTFAPAVSHAQIAFEPSIHPDTLAAFPNTSTALFSFRGTDFSFIDPGDTFGVYMDGPALIGVVSAAVETNCNFILPADFDAPIIDPVNSALVTVTYSGAPAVIGAGEVISLRLEIGPSGIVSPSYGSRVTFRTTDSGGDTFKYEDIAFVAFPIGVPGPQGPTGAAGPAGPQGPAGAAGVPGPQGVAGPQGSAGAPGQSVVSVTEPPGANCEAGGARLDSAGGGMFICNGVDGASGAIGPAGAQGDRGPKGSTSRGCSVVGSETAPPNVCFLLVAAIVLIRRMRARQAIDGGRALFRVPAVLVIAVLLMGPSGCRDRSVGAAASQTGVAADCTSAAAVELLAAEFVRGPGQPVLETRTFAGLSSQPSGTLCLTAFGVSSAEVGMNSVTMFGASSFHNEETLTLAADFPLLAQNALTVELRGKPCGVHKPACAHIRVRIIAIPAAAPGPQIVVKEFEPINACCSDPTCDRARFTAAGGVCPGDARIRGPLPAEAPLSDTLVPQ